MAESQEKSKEQKTLIRGAESVVPVNGEIKFDKEESLKKIEKTTNDMIESFNKYKRAEN